MEELILQLQGYVLAGGAWASLVYVLIMTIAIVISPIPSSPLAIFAGAIFGWIRGMILTMTGMVIGAIIAFYIARIFGRPIVLKLVPHKKLKKLEKLIPENKLALAIFLLRIPPLPFFDAVSYAAGLTEIRFKPFLIATFFGLIPLVFVLSYFGEMTNVVIYFSIAIIIAAILFYFFAKHRSEDKN